jgi:PST family polysaccharide transporter
MGFPVASDESLLNMKIPMEKLQALLGETGSLRRQTLSGGNWMLLRSLAVAGADVIRAAVFARVLFPQDYGLMALATLVIGFLESFSATGIEFMIMRERDDPGHKLTVYWTVMMARGGLLTVLGCVLAFPIAHFYHRPDLVPVICVLSLTIMIRWMGGFGRELRQRVMDFRQVAIADTITAGMELVISLTLLLIFRTVWALVAYALVHAIATAVCSYVLHPWRPSVRFESAIVRSVLIFSSSVIGINICNYFFISFDVAVIGRILDVEQVGLYARASFLALLPVTYLANVLAPVFLPLLGNIGNDPLRRSQAFWRLLLTHIVFYGTIGALMILLSKPILMLIYGERWLGALDPFRILVIYGISKAIASVSSMTLFALDRPWMVTASTAMMAGLFAILCIPLTRGWGIHGTAGAVVVSGILSHLTALTMTAICVRRGFVANGGHE